MDLTKIEKPFGLLDKETQDALKEWPNGFEYYSLSGSWQSARSPAWCNTDIIRARPLPPQPRHLWLLLDSDGEVLNTYDNRLDAEKEEGRWSNVTLVHYREVMEGGDA